MVKELLVMVRSGNLYERVVKLGVRVIGCKQPCKGVTRSLEGGVIPRGLVLELFNVCPGQFKLEQLREFKKAKVTILGINPGHILPFEAVAYQKILESLLCRHGTSLEELESCEEKRNEVLRDVYREVLKAWYSCCGSWRLNKVRVAYVRRVKHLLLELRDVLNLREGDPILWSNLAYCESSGRGIPPEETVWTCMSNYFIKILQLSGDVIICLGRSSFKYVEGLKKGEAKTSSLDKGKLERMRELLADKSVIGIYHPSSRGAFTKYFEDGKESIVKRRLKDVYRRKIGDAVKAKSAEFIDKNDPH